MKPDGPDQITIVTRVSQDDQREYSDKNYCAVRITSKVLPELKQKLTFCAEHKESIGLYGVDSEMPDGIDVCFFDVAHMGAMCAKIEQELQKTDGKVVYQDAEAEAVWDQAEDAESESEWRTSGSFLRIYDRGLFFLKSGYKYTTGGVSTPDFDIEKIEGYFKEKAGSANTDWVHIKPKGDGNFFEELARDYQKGGQIWREVSREDYWSALEALLPLYHDGYDFLMCKPDDQTKNDVVYTGLVQIGFQDGDQRWDRYFARQIERDKFKEARLALRQHVFPQGN